ncbi:MAG: SH3 domain-containing protein [bacterium]|nr:SH3 domain-containing protein [bacterium]
MSDDFEKDDLDWLRGDDNDPGANGEGGDDDLPFDWQRQGKNDPNAPRDSRLGVTGQLPWLRDTDDETDATGLPVDNTTFDWQTDKDDAGQGAGEGRRLGVTGQLPWLQEDDAATEFEQTLDDVLRDEAIILPPSASPAALPAASVFQDEAADEDDFDDLPPWMRGMDMPDEDESPAFDTPETENVDALPSWMSGSLYADDDDEAVEETPAAVSGDALPSWMSGSLYGDEADSDTEPEEVSASSDADLPDWMSGSLYADEDEAVEEAPTASNADNGLPDWMSGVTFGTEDEEDELASPAASTADTGLPDWMSGVTFGDKDEAPAFADDDSELDEAPDWLRSAAPLEAAPAEEDEPEFDLDALFGDQEQPDFAAEADPFAQMTTDSVNTDDDDGFDLLGQLTAETGNASDDDNFDLLAQLTADSDDDAFAALFAESDKGSAAATNTDDDPFAAIFGEEDADDVFASTGAPTRVDDLFGAPADDAPAQDDFDFLTVASDEPDTLDEFDLDALFSDADAAPAVSAVQEQASPDEIDMADFLASLDLDDEEETPFEAPAPAAPAPISAINDEGDVDIDALFGREGDTDDLLRDLGLAEDEPAPAQDDFLSWFEQQQQPAPVASMDDADMDWLQDISTDDLVAMEALPDEAEAPFADDDFFNELTLEDTPSAPVGDGASYADVDDFLASLGESDLQLSEASESGLMSPSFDLDDLFKGLDDVPAPEKRTTAPVQLAPDAPDWLAGLSVSVGEALSAAAIVRRQKDRPLEELPERLRLLHERGLEIPTGAEGVSGALAPVRDTLPTIRVDPSTLVAPAAPVLTTQQQQHAALLQSIIGTQGEERAASRAARTRGLAAFPLERLLIALVLILAVVLPFFVNELRLGQLPPAQFAAGSQQEAFYDQINTLQEDDLVLIAAEYAPTGAAELDEATEAVLRHVLARGAVPVIVGGSPTGLLHVGNLVDGLNPSALIRGNDYYIGRFLPGDALGLRTFAENAALYLETDVQGQPTGLTVDSLDDFAALVLIAERAETARFWMEQVVSRTNVPLLTVVGASAAPLVEPYLSDSAGLLIGYRDAYTYRSVLAATFGGLVPLLPTDEVTPPVTPEITPEETPAATPEATDVPGVLPPDETAQVTATATAAATEELTSTAVQEAIATATEEPTATTAATATEEPTNTPRPTATERPTNTPTATPEPVRYGIVTANQRINVRSGPSTGDSPVTSLAPGARVLIVGENEDATWYEVLTEEGEQGWITATLLRIEIGDAPTPTRRPKLFIPANRAQAQSTPESTPDEAVEQMLELTPELTPFLLEDLPSVPNVEGAAAFLDEPDYRAERWYGMNLGIAAAVVVILLGNLVSLIAAARRSAARRRTG